MPLFAGTLLLIVAPYAIWRGHAEAFGYFAFGLGCAVMAGSSFGIELRHRTLSLLLSQPIPRRVVWREKMLVLGTAMALSTAALWLCLALFYRQALDSGAPVVLALIPLCTFCGAPFFTLLLQHEIAGTVLSAALPGALLSVNALVNWWLFGDDATGERSAGPLLLLYCALVYWRGYAKFKTLQVVEATPRELGLPTWLETALARPLAKVSARLTGPFANLLKKELRLQQISFLCAGTFLLVALTGACLYKIRPGVAQGIIGVDFAVYLLILPLLAGAISVAEEAGWGVADWHLTLPPSARQQWSAKMLVTLSISFVLGVLLPVAVFFLGDALFGTREYDLGVLLELLMLALVQLLMTNVAVYTASCSSSGLRAIILALCLILALAACVPLGDIVAELYYLHHFFLGVPAPVGTALQGWSGWLAVGTGLFLLLCLFQWFAFTNFRHRGLPRRRFLGQIVAALSCAVLFTAAFAVYCCRNQTLWL